MSLLVATIVTAIATAVLAVGAIVTAILAYKAFKKQSVEVAAVEKQVKGQEELTRQQAEQLELQQRQFEQQQTDRRHDQASRVFMWTELTTDQEYAQVRRWVARVNYQTVKGHVRNTSRQPVYDLHVNWRKGTALWDQSERLHRRRR
jgi:hypothetical protein